MLTKVKMLYVVKIFKIFKHLLMSILNILD